MNENNHEDTYFAIDCEWAVVDADNKPIETTLTEVALVVIDPHNETNRNDVFYRLIEETKDGVFPPALKNTPTTTKQRMAIASDIAAWITSHTKPGHRAILVSDCLVQDYMRLNTFLETYLEGHNNPLHYNGLDIDLLYTGFMKRTDMGACFTPDIPFVGQLHNPVDDVVHTAKKFTALHILMSEND